MPRSYPGSTPGVDPGSQGVIPRRFKRKKNFVTNGRTDERTDGRTDRRDGRNSDLDSQGDDKNLYHHLLVSNFTSSDLTENFRSNKMTVKGFSITLLTNHVHKVKCKGNYSPFCS